MRTLGQFFAAICAILFVISAVIVLLLINIEAKAFSSETYKQAFADQRLYERMPSILATALTSTMGQNINAVPFLRALAPEDWQNTISVLLPPEELKATTDLALDSTFDYLNGRSSSAAVADEAPFITMCSPSKKSAEYSGYDAIGLNPGKGANTLLVHSQPFPTRSSTPKALRPAG